MLVNLNLDGVEAAKPFEPVPAGVYSLAIDSATIVDNKSNPNGAPNLKLQFTILDQDNKKVFQQINLSQDSAPYLVAFLQSIFTELPTDLNLETEQEKAEFCASLTGLTCVAVLDVQKKYGSDTKKQNVIDTFQPMPL